MTVKQQHNENAAWQVFPLEKH